MEFTLQTTIHAPAKAIFEAWLNSNGHSEMTGGEANISDQIGEAFTAWDGYIMGKNILIEPNGKIIQSWRTTEFQDDQDDSQIELQFEEIRPNITQLTLIHTNVPEDGEHYIKGWEDHYFSPMKDYFDKS